jgi:hypothetical protein
MATIICAWGFSSSGSGRKIGHDRSGAPSLFAPGGPARLLDALACIRVLMGTPSETDVQYPNYGPLRTQDRRGCDMATWSLGLLGLICVGVLVVAAVVGLVVWLSSSPDKKD